MKYLIPNVGTAFRDYLNTDIPNVTATLKQIRDYTAHRDEFDEYPSLRAMTTVINWKSNVSGSDLTHNFRTALEADMVRGDMFYDPASGTIGLVNWYVDRMVDCLRTQITECNVRVSVERERAAPKHWWTECPRFTTRCTDGTILPSEPQLPAYSRTRKSRYGFR